MGDDPLAELQHLQLVGKVCQELDNHLGLSDRTLAEFIIHLGKEQGGSTAQFQSALAENGADFPDSFAESLLRLIKALTASTPKVAAAAKVTPASTVPRSEKDILFPGLAMKNSK